MHALHGSVIEGLAMAYLDVLLHISHFHSTARQLCMETDLLTHLPQVLHAYKCSLGSPLLPLLLDVLWNMLDTMPSPHVLPSEVCFI